MKLFLSWSGDVSKQISYVLRDWIPLVLPSVKPFLSPADIDKGTKWNGEISKELQETNFGIICLTKENLQSQWLAFEAGALSKTLDSRAATLLLGIGHSDVKQPLAMFQGCLFTKDEFSKLMKDVNKAADGEESRPNDQIDKVFEKFWPEIETQISLILKQNEKQESQKDPTTPVGTDFNLYGEELLALARQQNLLLSSPEKLFGPIIRKAVRQSMMETRSADPYFDIYRNTMLHGNVELISPGDAFRFGRGRPVPEKTSNTEQDDDKPEKT